MVLKRSNSFWLVICLGLFIVSLSTATPIYENFDTQANGVNGWTETGGNSATPTYNFNSPSNGLGCCPTPGFISAKDNNAGGTSNVLKLYAPIALFTASANTSGAADLSEFDFGTNGGTSYYIHFAIKQLSNQGNKPLTGNTGKIDILGGGTGVGAGITIQANLYNFSACPTCFNLPVGWNLPTENNLFSMAIFNKVGGGTLTTQEYDYIIRNVASFNIEVELHGDGADEVGFDGFGIDTVPEPSTFAMLGGGLGGLLWFARKRKQAVS